MKNSRKLTGDATVIYTDGSVMYMCAYNVQSIVMYVSNLDWVADFQS